MTAWFVPLLEDAITVMVASDPRLDDVCLAVPAAWRPAALRDRPLDVLMAAPMRVCLEARRAR